MNLKDGYISDEEATYVLTEEQKQDIALNQKNILIDMMVPGDGENFPVRIEHNTTYIVSI